MRRWPWSSRTSCPCLCDRVHIGWPDVKLGGALVAGTFAGRPPIRGDLKCRGCLVRSLNICEPLDEKGLAELLRLGAPVRWRKGELLFRAGEQQGAFFKITRGMVAVSSSLHDGRRQIVALRIAGDVVGYLESDGRYAFEGEALTDVEVCSFDRARFDRLVSQTPALASAVAETLSDALKQTAHGLTVIGRLKATERVANLLAEICTLYEQRPMLTGPPTLHMRRDEIADYLGLAAESVSRSLSRLRKLGIVDRRRDGGIVILDPKRLKVVAVEKR